MKKLKYKINEDSKNTPCKNSGDLGIGLDPA